MARAVSVCGSDGVQIRDTLLLGHEARRAPFGIVTGLRGTVVELALPAGTHLRQDDCLLLDDGGAVEVVARPDALLEVRAGAIATLARAAWLLGDHHIPVEIHARYLRLLYTPAAEGLLGALDVSVRRIEAPFEPEGGAYDHHTDSHRTEDHHAEDHGAEGTGA
jgi:urease accessory protein